MDQTPDKVEIKKIQETITEIDGEKLVLADLMTLQDGVIEDLEKARDTAKDA